MLEARLQHCDNARGAATLPRSAASVVGVPSDGEQNRHTPSRRSLHPRSSRRRRALINDPSALARFCSATRPRGARRQSPSAVIAYYVRRPIYFTSPTFRRVKPHFPLGSIRSRFFACQCPLLAHQLLLAPAAQRHGLFQVDVVFRPDDDAPQPRHDARRWWNCFWIAFRSSKMSAPDQTPKVVEDQRTRAVCTNLERLSKERVSLSITLR